MIGEMDVCMSIVADMLLILELDVDDCGKCERVNEWLLLMLKQWDCCDVVDNLGELMQRKHELKLDSCC